jgi:hypothetical protein
MTQRTGMYDIASLLATRNQSAAQFGMTRIQEILDRDLAIHNGLLADMLGELVDTTTDRQRIYGSSQVGKLMKVDEFGRGPTQRPAANAQTAFPLWKFQYPVGWTREWEEERTPADFATAMQAAQIAHRQESLNELRRSFMLSANYTFTDMLVDNITFTIRRLLNGDGSPIPNGANGEIFNGATHTHYMANAGLTTAVATALINTVVEHGHGLNVRIYISTTDEAAWRGLTGFVALLDPRIIFANNVVNVNERLDITRTDNRRIGIYGASEVWVKPWMPAGYAFCFSQGDANKPFVLRERLTGSAGLRVMADLDAHPLRAQYMEAKFGFGVWTRTNGAMLYTGGASYVDPSI